MKQDEIIKALAALAQEHRLAIFRLLVREGRAGLAASDIAQRAGVSPTNASFHLKERERAGLIGAKREGRFIRYAIEVDAINQLLQFLTQDCCQGRPELCGGVFVNQANRCQGASA